MMPLAILTSLLSVATPVEIPLTLDNWQFSNGAEFPGASGSQERDGNALRLKFDFSKGGAYVAAYRAFDAPLELASLNFRVKKPTEARLTVRVTDSIGQTVQKGFTFDHAEWQKVQVGMGGWADHWGGANDGVLHPPMVAVGILVESQGLVSPSGEILISEVAAQVGQASERPAVHRGSYVVTDFGADAGFYSESGTLGDRLWSADFRAGNRVALHHSISLLGIPREFRLKVRGGAAGNLLKMRLGSHFQTFERTVGALDGGEQTFEILVPPEGWTHYGGENDGVVRHPLRLATLTLEKGDAPAEPVAVELGELRCVTETPRTNAVTLLARMNEEGADADKRALSAACFAWNLLDEPVTGTLTATLRNWENDTLHREAVEWTLPANGVRAQRTFQMTIPAALNFADAEFTFDAEGFLVRPSRAGFTRLATDLSTGSGHRSGDATLRPESPWGMGVYLYRYPDNPDGYAQMDRAAAMAQAAGVKWSREEFSWGHIERQPGEYDFHYYDVVVETAQRHGISVYGLLAYWSLWTDAYTEKGVDDFVRWTRAVVRRYKDRIRHWEIYNEPNIFFWSGPKELYPVLLKKCGAVIKEEDPDALVLGISTAGIDSRFIQFCLDANAPFDILTIHPYRGTFSEEGFIAELQATARQVGNRPVWITEMGWSTQIGGTDERAQAQLLARCYLSAVASGTCRNVSWYNFRSDGSDPFYNEHNFGVLRADLTPKAGYRALMTVCRTLERGTPTFRTDFGEGIYALEMGDGLALWSPNVPVKVVVRVAEGTPQAVNLMGDSLSPKREGDLLTVSLPSGSPVMLRGGKVVPTGRVIPAEDSRGFPEVMRF